MIDVKLQTIGDLLVATKDDYMWLYRPQSTITYDHGNDNSSETKFSHDKQNSHVQLR